MYRLTRAIVRLLLLFHLEGLSQSIASVETELGVNVSSLPRFGQRAGGRELTLPVVSPLTGIWLTALPQKRFNLGVGAQYYSQGQHYKYTMNRYDRITNSKYYATTSEEMKFHQVSTIIMANYHFPLRSGALGLSLGYRLSNYVAGHYVYQAQGHERNVDPFSNDLNAPANRSRSQVCLAMQYSFTNRWTASVSYSVGEQLWFIEPFFGGCATGSSHTYQRGDIGMSVRYRCLGN